MEEDNNSGSDSSNALPHSSASGGWGLYWMVILCAGLVQCLSVRASVGGACMIVDKSIQNIYTMIFLSNTN